MVVLVAGIVVWVGMRLFAEQGPIELSPHHPFRSQRARERYLSLYDRRAEKWPVPSQCTTVDTSFGQTFVRVSGPAAAPSLVLLPGANATSLIWTPNIEALSGAYRVYAVDTISDFGRSVYTRKITTSEHLVSWLDELFQALDLGDEVRLMGLSYGGWISAQCALRAPQRLERVVLVAPAGTVLPLSSGFILHAVPCVLPLRYPVRRMMDWLFEDTVSQDERYRDFLEDSVENAYVGLRCFKPVRLVNPLPLSDEEFESIAVPTLFVVGENEKIYSATEAVARLERVAPQIQTVVLPDCGHDLTLVQADTFNRTVLDFLTE